MPTISVASNLIPTDRITVAVRPLEVGFNAEASIPGFGLKELEVVVSRQDAKKIAQFLLEHLNG